MLILASQSPRRKDILNKSGFTFDIKPASIEERLLPQEKPLDYVTRLAQEKSAHVAQTSSARDLILGADTIVVLNQEILEKPLNYDDAYSMIKKLSGQTHTVMTATCLMKAPSKLIDLRVTQTKVHVKELSRDDIQTYLDYNEYQDKAGGYGIQGAFGEYISGIEGSLNNVIGLPIEEIEKIITRNL